MYLKFVTDGSVQNLGFKLNYESFSDNGPPKGERFSFNFTFNA